LVDQFQLVPPISDFHCNPKPAAFVSHEIVTYPARGRIVNVGCGANVKVNIVPPLDTAISSLQSRDWAVAGQNWSWGAPLLAQVLPKSSEISKTPLNWASAPLASRRWPSAEHETDVQIWFRAAVNDHAAPEFVET
jgi:hypothetical protein